ncbi:transcription factor TFIIIB component B'' homolog [Bacillus rossius redtenbacheri]|uniref:transcription factor TFIIIB component B'' homolog n=1 Tax=Bacillus rossius redtenbacheri TaxID=93214 RepID=UPI002FDEC970
MLRRTRIKAVANLPVRRAKDVAAGNAESTPTDTTDKPEPAQSEDDHAEMHDVPAIVLLPSDSASPSISSANQGEAVFENHSSIYPGCVVEPKRSINLEVTPSVHKICDLENDDSLHKNLSLEGAAEVSQDISSPCLSLDTLSPDKNDSQALDEGRPEQSLGTGSDMSSGSSVAGGSVSRSRYARCIPRLPSRKDGSGSTSSSGKETEDRHRAVKPTLPQLSPARGDRSLEQRKLSTSTPHSNEELSSKPVRLKKVHRKVHSSITVRLSKARQEFVSKYKDERPDRSRLTMFDLIYYNPVTNPMKQRKQHKSLMQLEDNELENQRIDEEDVDAGVSNDNEETSLPVPQVRLGADGQLIIDETSLVIETTDTIKSKQILASSSVVVEGGEGSSSYLAYNRKVKSRRSTTWTKTDTLRFYVGLKTFGTDFLLMQSIFPQFSRQELKLKFRSEERLNKELVQETLRQQHFDPERMKRDLSMLEEKELKLLQEKTTVKKKEYVRVKKSNTKSRTKIERTGKAAWRVDVGERFEERSSVGPPEDSLDEAEVDSVWDRSERNENAEDTTSVSSGKEIVDANELRNVADGVVINPSTKVTRLDTESRACEDSPSGKQKNIKGKSRRQSGQGRKRKVRQLTYDEETCETKEIYSTEKYTKRVYVAFSDTSDSSRDKSDVDEEVCSIVNALKEKVASGSISVESFRDEIQRQYVEKEPVILENELRRLVGSKREDGAAGSSSEPMEGQVPTPAPAPGSLFIVSTVSPADPSHTIYKVFMVTPPEQTQIP